MWTAGGERSISAFGRRLATKAIKQWFCSWPQSFLASEFHWCIIKPIKVNRVGLHNRSPRRAAVPNQKGYSCAVNVFQMLWDCIFPLTHMVTAVIIAHLVRSFSNLFFSDLCASLQLWQFEHVLMLTCLELLGLVEGLSRECPGLLTLDASCLSLIYSWHWFPA